MPLAGVNSSLLVCDCQENFSCHEMVNIFNHGGTKGKRSSFVGVIAVACGHANAGSTGQCQFHEDSSEQFFFSPFANKILFCHSMNAIVYRRRIILL